MEGRQYLYAPQRPCMACGGAFPAKHLRQRYCSARCREAEKRERRRNAEGGRLVPVTLAGEEWATVVGLLTAEAENQRAVLPVVAAEYARVAALIQRQMG